MLLGAWQRPTLAGGSPQLPLAQKSLTTVFGMGTGVPSLLSPPDFERQINCILLPLLADAGAKALTLIECFEFSQN